MRIIKFILILFSILFSTVIVIAYIYPWISFVLLSLFVDADVAQELAENAFEKSHPDLIAVGGSMSFNYFDPFAYTIEVHGKLKPLGVEKENVTFSELKGQIVKKEIYRVNWRKNVERIGEAT